VRPVASARLAFEVETRGTGLVGPPARLGELGVDVVQPWAAAGKPVSRLSDHHLRFPHCARRGRRVPAISPGFAVDLDIGDPTVYT
jgi:hypothetical protein